MYPGGYGNPFPPPDPYRPPHNQHGEHPDQYQHPHHHRQHYPPAYASSSFQHPSALGPPYSPFDNTPPPHAPPGPEYQQHPLHPPAPTHQSLYPPPPELYHSTFGAHILSSSEYAYARPTYREYSHPPSEHAYAPPRPAFDHPHGPYFPHHTSSFQEIKPRILEQVSAAPLERDLPTDVELPKGQLVRVFCKSSRNYNLAVKDGRLTMVEADSGNESQQWIRDDKYSIRIRDSYGHPAFMLMNKASKKVLKHASGKLQEVQLTYYSPDKQDDDLFWSESQDFGEGFKTLRMASDTLLNLSVSSGNKIEDGSPIILDTWHKKDTQLWKIFPL